MEGTYGPTAIFPQLKLIAEDLLAAPESQVFMERIFFGL